MRRADDASAWATLGDLQRRQRKFRAALRLYHQARSSKALPSQGRQGGGRLSHRLPWQAAGERAVLLNGWTGVLGRGAELDARRRLARSGRLLSVLIGE